MACHLPVEKILGSVKNQIGRYFRGLRGSSKMRAAVYDCRTFQELTIMLDTARLAADGDDTAQPLSS